MKMKLNGYFLIFVILFFFNLFRYYCRLRSYKKRMFFFLSIDVFFDVESESEIHFCRSLLFLEL